MRKPITIAITIITSLHVVDYDYDYIGHEKADYDCDYDCTASSEPVDYDYSDHEKADYDYDYILFRSGWLIMITIIV